MAADDCAAADCAPGLAACMRGWNEGRVGLAEAGCGGAVAADDCAAADCARNLRTSASVASRCARFI